MPENQTTRRSFLGKTLYLSSAATLLASPLSAQEQKETEVSPAEDLMREHGVLRRILLVYDEIIRRLQAKQSFTAETLVNSATIIRHFIEDYHEQLEEKHIFPRFEKAGKLVDLVSTLRAQHLAGRKVTERIITVAKGGISGNADQQKELIGLMSDFMRMYRPHAAREDTVLFPAFHPLLTAIEYDGLGETFEKQENQLFGEGGFEKIVNQVAEIEKSLGIYELAQFTPKQPKP